MRLCNELTCSLFSTTRTVRGSEWSLHLEYVTGVLHVRGRTQYSTVGSSIHQSNRNKHDEVFDNDTRPLMKIEMGLCSYAVPVLGHPVSQVKSLIS